MKPSVRCLVLSLLAVVVVAARAADDLTALSGTWKPAKAELGGQQMAVPVLKMVTLRLDGANYEVIVEGPKGNVVDKGTVALDSAATPKTMTITGVEGPNAGKTFRAIYELTGDTMRVCYDLAGERPTEFKSAPGTKLYLVNYARAK